MVGIETAGFNQMSNNTVEIMKAIARNKGIRVLLSIDRANPFVSTLEENYEDEVPSSAEILNPKSKKNKILPVSFDTDAVQDKKTEIRVYYNVGRVDGSGKQIESNMHIDIICAKELWLIKGANGKSLIRPYEIMSRIADEIGANNRNGINIGRISQFQMLSVNDDFDSIRIYYSISDIAGNVNALRG